MEKTGRKAPNCSLLALHPFPSTPSNRQHPNMYIYILIFSQLQTLKQYNPGSIHQTDPNFSLAGITLTLCYCEIKPQLLKLKALSVQIPKEK